MSQVTIYLDKHTETEMRSAAKAMNMSQSKWVAQVIEEKLAAQWPESIKQMAGAWSDFPTAEENARNNGTRYRT